MTDSPDWDVPRAGCDRALNLHGPSRAADLLATIPSATAVDRYGDGGVVAELEAETARLLGSPAAVYLPGVRVVPDPPQTPMLHLLLATTREACTAAAVRLAEEGLWTWQQTMPTDDPGVLKVELSVGDATVALPVTEVRAALAALAGA